MSDRNFMKLLGPFEPAPGDLPDPELGVVKVQPGHDSLSCRRPLRAALPDNVAVLTKQEFIDQETTFQSTVSGVGPIFGVGTVIGFAVGMMICTRFSTRTFPTNYRNTRRLKAIGYDDIFLIKVVFEQAVFYGLVGFLPAWLIALALYRVLGAISLLPLHMTMGLTLASLALTVGMCILSALAAVRRVLRADPAEVF